MVRRREVALLVESRRRSTAGRARRRLIITALVGCYGLIASAAAFAGPPTINSISLRGLQTGATTTIAIDGSDLLPEPRLVLSVPIAKQALRSGGNAQHIELEVSLGAELSPGTYNLRLANASGISNPVLIGLDSLAQLPVAPQLSTLPAALSGSISGGQVVRTSFKLTKGEQIAVEVEAKRLGGGLDPVINLLDERKLPLAWAEGMTALGGDARLLFTAPADGQYTVQLHDALYQGASPGHFRLKIGSWHFADMVFPFAVRRGDKATFKFVSSNLPPDAKVEFTMPDDRGDQTALWPAGMRLAGFPPRVFASDDEQVLKSPPANGSLQQVAAPVGINGRLDKPHGEDRYRVAVAPGMRLRIEVTASRIGSPLDAVLFVRDEKGNQLAMNDDQPNTVDPGLDFTVPSGLAAIVVALKDVAGRGGPDFIYHLAVSRLDQPDFSLSLADDRHLIPAGGNALVRVTANRRGYNGPINLAFNGLPPGIKVFGDEIAAGSNLAFVEVSAQTGGPDAAVVSITGRGADGDHTIIRAAQTSGAGSEAARAPWLRTEVGIAAIASPAFDLAWDGLNDVTTGTKTPVSVKLTRGVGATGPLRLSLVTSQPMPKKKVKVNNQDQEQDDPDRALRLDGSPTIAADQSEATASVVVPGDLPLAPYDLTVRGDLLTADGKSVVAQTFTPVLHLKAVAPPPKKKPPEAEAAKGSGKT